MSLEKIDPRSYWEFPSILCIRGRLAWSGRNPKMYLLSLYGHFAIELEGHGLSPNPGSVTHPP